MRKILLFLIALSLTVFFSCTSRTSTMATQERIYIDQFGYRPQDSKIAIIAYNSSDTDALDGGGQSYQVRDIQSDQVVYQGRSEVWKSAAIHDQSGDRAAWFDFSSVHSPGVYVIENGETGQVSSEFQISNDIYRDILIAATRMFFYQRSGFPKHPPFADERWVDEAAFLGPHQDTEARFIGDKDNSALARDMRGGWFDAGDTNKYVTFASRPIHQLLDAYSQNPNLWTDDFNIPESGNDIPDLLDEIKYELDWLQRMQDEDGGVFIKLGTLDHHYADKPSLDQRPRYYAPKCSSATIDVSGMFAHAALVLKQFPRLEQYADDLEQRAFRAWQWYHAHPKETDCDTQEIQSGDADRSLENQKEMAIVAAIYLFDLTQDATYGQYVIEHYAELCPYCDEVWYPYHPLIGDALFYYTHLEQGDTSIQQDFLERFNHLINQHPEIYGLDTRKDPYRAYMPDPQYHWGSNTVKALYGVTNGDASLYGLNLQQKDSYLTRALDTLHYFHGVNPLGLVYLTNMYEYGAEHSANEMYHQWFGHGIYDNALRSPSGPAPAYLTGGPNRDYTGSADISHLPPMKAYVDSNESGKMKMWEITEPAIYYQSAYIKLLARFCK